MKKILLPVLFTIVSLTSMNTAAQVVEEPPIDTLTRSVAGMQQVLEVMSRTKITGYIQAQYQVTDSAGSKGYAGGDFLPGVDKRFQLRRARVKIQYDAPINQKGWSTSQYVFQIDVSQAGLTIKDVYAKFTDPWSGWFSITAGMQNRPFGYEIPYSSGLRESPERGRMSQIIMPNERDLGAMLTIQGPKFTNWNWIKIDLGMFNGTGGPSAGANTSDFDKYKDFIGHIGLSKSTISERIKWGIGASIYQGGFRQDTVASYKYGVDSAGAKGFTIDKKKSDVSPTINNRSEVNRNYIGGDGQLSIDWMAGLTTLRAEYIEGEQPGTSGTTASPAVLPSASSDIYIRNFNGAYFYFIHNIMQSPFQVVVKYDWYDPNTDVAGDEIGKSGLQSGYKTTNATDLKYTTVGLGLVYRWDANVKITAYFDNVKNETSKNLAGWTQDIKDNVFTLRAQVKF